MHLNLSHERVIPIISTLAENHFYFVQSHMISGPFSDWNVKYLLLEHSWNLKYLWEYCLFHNLLNRCYSFLNLRGYFDSQDFPFFYLFSLGIYHCRLVNNINSNYCCWNFVLNFQENIVKEFAIAVCLVGAVVWRVVYFLDFVEKVDILGLIEVVPQLLYFAIGLLIYHDFLIFKPDKWFEKAPPKFVSTANETKKIFSLTKVYIT